MAGVDRENPLSAQAIEISNGLIRKMADLGIREFSDVAERIEDRKLFIVPKGYLIGPGATNFDLSEIAGSVQPSIVVNAEKILSFNKEDKMADMVRTCFVASQYPHGFLKRQRNIYSRALNAQRNWLNEMHIGDVFLDPRMTDNETLIKQLLGKDRYYSDLSFDDLQETIGVCQIGQNPSAFEFLNKLRNPVSFIAKRNELGVADRRLLGLSADERARMTANKMILTALHSGIRLN